MTYAGPFFFTLAVLSPIVLSTPASSEEIDCFSCREDLINGTSVHQAVSIGCSIKTEYEPDNLFRTDFNISLKKE